MISAAVFGEIKDGKSNVSKNYIKHLNMCGIDSKIVHEQPPWDAAKHFDFLLVCGGGDIDPTLYGQKPINGSKYDRIFDNAEQNYIKAFINNNKPILGICRGMQSINVALSGTLIQDIPSMLGFSHSNSSNEDMMHEIKISRNSLLYRALGLRAVVNSQHHQCVHSLGCGLYVAAKSHDGVIEAVESHTHRILGVQWHPERMNGNAVFDHFITKYVKAG